MSGVTLRILGQGRCVRGWRNLESDGADKVKKTP